jgi:PHD/YefM family antitoxin component YafN of YafNO toxin-antitoxin module
LNYYTEYLKLPLKEKINTDTIFQPDEAIKDFYKIFYDATHNSLAVKIEGKDGKSVMVISEDNYRSLQETLYLIKNPENFKNSLKSTTDNSAATFNSIQDLKNAVGG